MKLYNPLKSARENLAPELQRKFYLAKDDSEIQAMNPYAKSMARCVSNSEFFRFKKGNAVNMPYITQLPWSGVYYFYSEIEECSY